MDRKPTMLQRIIKSVGILFVLLMIGFSVKSIADALSPREKLIDQRTAPMGDIYLEGSVPVLATKSGPMTTEERYEKVCALCHQSGVAGAPVLGNRSHWESRLGQGMEALVNNAIRGIKGMPPRGTCMDCSDDEIKALVEFMIEESQ